MIDFLLEIGCEELPPSFLPKSAQDLTDKFETLLKKEKIFYRTVRTIYTSRRIGLVVLGLSRKQKPQTAEIQGPPRKFAYDEGGNPTQVLLGFMKSNDLKPAEIQIIKTPKGEYVAGRKELVPKDTEEILYAEVPKLIAGLEFPKTMTWNSTKVRFPRPIRWIVALLDRRPLRFEYAGTKADRYSMPNFHFSFEPIRLDKPREYLSRLRHGGVVVDPNERRKIIVTRIRQAAGALKSEALHTPEMIENINCTVEYPDVVTGEFSPDFLLLPPEVLSTTLRVNGDLIWIKDTNKFVCIFGAKKKASDNVKKGYTQVVNAKLNDALFFHNHDVKTGIKAMQEKTREMTWLYSNVMQRSLGTIYDKTIRLQSLAKLMPWGDNINKEHLVRAAALCKADLVSEMVGEKDFTSLQGIMGAYYARAAGEPETVSQAIKDHYYPRFAGDVMPATPEGAALSVCDKIDHVLGSILSMGVRSGSSDPLAIRRNGYAAIQIMDRFEFDVSIFKIRDLLLNAYDINKDKPFERDMPGNIIDIFNDFIKDQMSRYLEEQGYLYDEINSVLIDKWDGNVINARLRCAALKEWRKKPDFEKLVIGQKRVRNILDSEEKKLNKDGKKTRWGKPDENLFTEPAEKQLFSRGLESSEKLDPLYTARDYKGILNILFSLRDDIDTFFDKVMVICEDLNLRKNRLALLDDIHRLFTRFADLSQIVIETEKKTK